MRESTATQYIGLLTERLSMLPRVGYSSLFAKAYHDQYPKLYTLAFNETAKASGCKARSTSSLNAIFPAGSPLGDRKDHGTVMQE